MRVELDVALKPAYPERIPAPTAPASTYEERQKQLKEERLLRRIALAQVIEKAVADGRFEDLAAVAHRCRVSRARVSALVEGNR